MKTKTKTKTKPLLFAAHLNFPVAETALAMDFAFGFGSIFILFSLAFLAAFAAN
jgi:hypothetical protein